MTAFLTDVQALLTEAGYIVQRLTVASHQALLAESPEALVACFTSGDWQTIAEDLFEVQAALTHQAASQPSPKRWDLYVVAFLERGPMTPLEERRIEEIESDTRFARKFVRTLNGLQRDKSALTKALLPLLPLRIAPRFDLADPLVMLESELRRTGIAQDVVTHALVSFRSKGSVELP